MNSEYIDFPSPLMNLDHEWNYVYVSYSYELNKVYAYIYFTGSEDSRIVEWNNH